MKYPMLVLCAVALTSTALAEDPSSTKSSGDLFTMVDADGDGKVTKEEAATNASFEKNFAALDGNSDGVVTEREYQRNTMPKSK
jgi:Ca2+-binding EF-hand superfamily protein